MAVRTSASTQNYSATLSQGSQTKVSITLWAKISVDRNANSCVWLLQGANTSDVLYLCTNVDGVMLFMFDQGGNSAPGPVLTVGTWYFLGLSYNAGALSLVSRALDATAFTTTALSLTVTSHTFTSLFIANSQAGGSGGLFLNGCVCAVKSWVGTALSEAALQNEAWSYLPKYPKPTFWYPLLKTETSDYSGNGYTLTGGTGATTEDGPGIGWGLRLTGLYVPAVTVVTHALTATGLSTSSDVAALRLRMPLAAVGLSTSSGTASLHVVSGLTATGLSTSADTAALRVTRAMAGIGLSAAADQASLNLIHALTATGWSSSAGSANLTVTIVAVGLSTSSDSAALALLMPLAGIGLEVSYDSADVTLEFPLAAEGLSSSSDSAVLYIALPYVPSPTRAPGVGGGRGLSGPTGLTRSPGQTGVTRG